MLYIDVKTLVAVACKERHPCTEPVGWHPPLLRTRLLSIRPSRRPVAKEEEEPQGTTLLRTAVLISPSSRTAPAHTIPTRGSKKVSSSSSRRAHTTEALTSSLPRPRVLRLTSSLVTRKLGFRFRLRRTGREVEYEMMMMWGWKLHEWIATINQRIQQIMRSSIDMNKQRRDCDTNPIHNGEAKQGSGRQSINGIGVGDEMARVYGLAGWRSGSFNVCARGNNAVLASQQRSFFRICTTDEGEDWG